MAEKKYEIHIVSQTHWDREWYSTFQEYRMRLVKLVDKLLGIYQTIPGYKYFVFDGQAIVLEDYLEIRPEKKDEIKKYVQENRLLVGPWYILPDEFLVSGESIIRNLLIGHKISDEFGRTMKAGYIPDPFGHISQLPQIFKGFNIDSIIFTRGLGDEGKKLGLEFLWESPDGTQILGIHQIQAYHNAHSLGYSQNNLLDLELALKRAIELKTDLSQYNRTKYLLFNNGADHIEPQPELPEIIQHLNDTVSDSEFIHSTFEDFINKVKSANVKFEIRKGELRSARYFHLLPGVLSSRMYLKQANEQAQTKIEKYAEPLAALAYLEGNEYPQEILGQSWKYLIQSHPHDSICGCSIDAVHQDVIRRLSWSQEITDNIKFKSQEYLLQKIDTCFSDSTSIPIIIFNTLNWSCTGPVKMDLTFTQETIKNAGKKYVIKDDKGKQFPVQAKGVGDFEWNPLRLGHFYHQKISFLAEGIPSCGYRTYSLVPVDAIDIEAESEQNNLKIGRDFLENEYYRLDINQNGTLKIKDKSNNITYNHLHVFEDVEDAGDEYNYSPAKKSKKYVSTKNTKIKTSIYEQGPVTVTVKLDMNLFLPEGLTEDRQSRSKKLVNCNIRTLIGLHSGVKRIDFHTIIDNQAKDHRIRVLFPTKINTECSFAEGQFSVNQRQIDLPSGKDWLEMPSSTHPQQSFVSINDNTNGLTVINQGLPEYEAIKTSKGTTIALTLLRCVGWLSRDDLLTRKGNTGPQIATYESQCLGKQEFKYSMVIHSGNWEKTKVWKQSYEHNIPLTGVMSVQHKGVLPKELSFISIEPANIIISALKKSERNNNIILRFYNSGTSQTNARIKFYKEPKRVQIVNLNEEPIQGNIKTISSNVFEIETKPFQIITIEIEFGIS